MSGKPAPMDMEEYFKRRNPFYFLDELYKSLVKLEEEAKNVVLLYERDVNIPERKDQLPYETPFMLYLKLKRLRSQGLSVDDAYKIIEKSNPKLKLEEIKLEKDKSKKQISLDDMISKAEGEEMKYLFSLERYRLERMHIIGWSIIKNAFYVMDWASRVVETASAAANMIQAFGDELDLPAGLTADLSKLASLAMDVAGYVQRGIGTPKVWAYRFRAAEEGRRSKIRGGKKIRYTISKILIERKDRGYKKFIRLGDPLLVLSGGLTVNFSPVKPEDYKMEEWRVPIWGVLSVFAEKGDELEDGDIIMFLYSAYARVLTSSFERAYYECWNRLKMVIKKVKLAMDLLQTKQKLIAQLMKAAPMPEEHVEIEAAEVKPPEEIEGE